MTEPETAPKYFVRSMGKITGPFDVERLQRLRSRGQFGPASEVSIDKRNWQAWDSLEALQSRTRSQSGHSIRATSAESVSAAAVATLSTAPTLNTPAWYYADDNGSAGPVSRPALIQMIANGQLRADSLAWREGQAEWQPISTIPELSSLLNSTSQSANPLASQSQRRLRYSNFWRRFAAQLFDFVILQSIGIGLGFLVVAFVLPSGSSEQVLYTCAVSAQILLNWLYNAAMESSMLQGTFGKLAMELKVTTLTGTRVSFGQASARYFGKILSALLFGIGFLMIGMTEKRQGLHDLLSDCLVLDQESGSVLSR